MLLQAAKGGGWLSPAPSSTAQKPGRGLALRRLPPPPPLHPTHKTGNHKHPSQLCERTYIFSTHSIQYSKKSYRFLKKKNNKPLNFQNNHQSFQIAPHPTALTLVLLARTRQPAASDPNPTPSLPGKGQRVAPALRQHLMPQHPAPPAEPGVLRMLPPEKDLASRLLRCYPVQLFGGHAHRRKSKNRAGSGCQPGASSRSLAGAGRSPRDVPGRRGDPIADAGAGGGVSTLGSLRRRLRCFLPEVGGRGRGGGEERHGGGDGGAWQGPRRCARRGGRSALETSCPGGCLLGHQLGFWGGKRAHRRALNACACLLPRGRCLGACLRRRKALELGGGTTFLETF